MKKSLWISILCMALALLALPLAWRAIDREKDAIMIQEEILSGDPAVAEGVTLRLASHWDGHLLWNTEYTIGSGKTESKFTFSTTGVEWGVAGAESAKADFLNGAGFGTAYGDNEMIVNPEDLPYPEIIRAVGAHTEAGAEWKETVKISDFYQEYPVTFDLEGSSVEYEGDYEQACLYLTELFHIPTAEDWIELSMEKNGAGDLISVSGSHPSDSRDLVIRDASAFGAEGCYYAFTLASQKDGTKVDRGENSGIFYLPYKREAGWIRVDLTQMKKLCPLPEDAGVEAMLLDEEQGLLYLTVKETADYSLLVYDLEGEVPVLIQRETLKQTSLFDPEEHFEDNLVLGDEQTQVEVEVLAPAFRNMTKEDGGLLMTWSDNRFSFVAEEDGGYRLWCTGQFPETREPEYVGAAEGKWARNNLFPVEQVCLFDGERLVLAAYEGWDSLNVVLGVYGEDGEVYTGLYRYSGESDRDSYWNDFYRRLPQGRERLPFIEKSGAAVVYLRETGEVVRPLEIVGGRH